MIFHPIIGGGASISAKAYASADELPTTAKDGTIAVISATPVGNVYAQSAEPTEPLEGDVWVAFGVDGNVPVATGNVIIYPSEAKQYLSGSWVEKTILIFAEGEWKTLFMYLFHAGNTYESITGGWTSTGYTSPNGSNTQGTVGDSIVCKAVSGSSANACGVVGTVNPVQISGKKTLRVIGNISGYVKEAVYYISLLKAKGNGAGDYVARISLTQNGDFNATADLTEVEGEFYPCVCSHITYGPYEFTATLTVNTIVIE